MRVGIGIDFHKFCKNRKFILGGIEIPYIFGLAGHSDADCLIHSIMDALLGAIGESDIGVFFPNTDKNYKDIDSKILLSEVCKIIAKKRYAIQNIDSSVMCEEPKIMPYSKSMKDVLSKTLGITTEQIGVKATTTEQMGFVGRKEGVVCISVAMLKKLAE